MAAAAHSAARQPREEYCAAMKPGEHIFPPHPLAFNCTARLSGLKHQHPFDALVHGSTISTALVYAFHSGPPFRRLPRACGKFVSSAQFKQFLLLNFGVHCLMEFVKVHIHFVKGNFFLIEC
ncbi:MAG: hypothetical protein ACLRRT_06005 [Ruthenibacterium lactatiformans]